MTSLRDISLKDYGRPKAPSCCRAKVVAPLSELSCGGSHEVGLNPVNRESQNSFAATGDTVIGSYRLASRNVGDRPDLHSMLRFFNRIQFAPAESQVFWD